MKVYDTDGKLLVSAAGSSGDIATDNIWDNKGDLAVGTGANSAYKLPVGSNDQVLVADSGEVTGMKWASISGGSSTWTSFLSSINTTPASTSTIITTDDLTNIIKPGFPIKYTIGTVEYYGIVTVIVSNLITIAGISLSGTISSISYGDPARTRTETFVVNGYYADASNTTLIESDLFIKGGFIWTNAKAYIVSIGYLHAANDSGATQPKINFTIASSDLLTADASISTTLANSVVNINSANYDVNFGEAIEIDVTKGTNGDAHDLTVYYVAVFP